MNKEYWLCWQLIGTIYTIGIVSIGLSTTLYFAVSKSTPGHAEFHEIFFAALYGIGTVAIGTLFWHVRCSSRRLNSRRQLTGAEDNAAAIGDGDDDNVDIEGEDSQPAVVFSGEGFNVYLRVGLAVFLTGCVALNLLRVIAQLLHAPAGDCSRVAAVLMNVLEIAFTVSQAALILRYHRIVFLRRKAQSRMALAHLFTANICIWASSAIGEIKEQLSSELRERAVTAHNNATATAGEVVEESAAGACETSWRLVETARPFLTPAVIEYCLLAAPMVLHMLASVGDHRAFADKQQQQRTLLAPVCATPEDSTISASAPASHHLDCRGALRRRFAKSRRGLAFSVAAFAGTALVTVIVYQFLSGEAATVAYLVQDLVLSGTGLGFCLAVQRTMRQRLGLAKRERHTFDDKLLLFALFGSLVYQVTLAVVMVDHAQVFPSLYLGAELLSLLICALQLAAQTFCLLDGLRRRVRCLSEVQAKPGRGLLLALLGINLSMWIMETFEVRKAEELLFSYRLDNVSDAALRIVIHIGQPLNIFYRFHSTVCLSIIWRRAYQMPDALG